MGFGHWGGWPPKENALGLGSLQPGLHALADQVALELCDRGEDVKEQAPRRGGGVDLLVQHDEVDAQRGELTPEADQVMGRARQAIELRHGDDIDLPGARCLDEPVQRGASFLRAADAVVDELLVSSPALRRSVSMRGVGSPLIARP